MEILNLGGAEDSYSPAPKARKKLRVILGIGALAAVTGIGSTLAANISLNGGGNVEFGQGVATTAACDDSITLTPVSTFSNTEEDPTFAMTAIQVSGIDLTPEGWDVTLNSGDGGWDENFNYSDHTWDPGHAVHSGKYKNSSGIWTNTCENKVMMLRAYTDNYPESTAENNVASPLYLNGDQFVRGGYETGNNAGIGFRIRHLNSSFISEFSLDLLNDDNYRNAFSPLQNDSYYVDGNNSTVSMGLNDDSKYPPLDSRWVDKITIESAAGKPSNWNLWD